MNKIRGTAIINYDNGIILIKRIKGYGQNKEIYYTIPCGGQEKGETIEETTKREIKEELEIDIVLTDKYYEIESQGRKQLEKTDKEIAKIMFSTSEAIRSKRRRIINKIRKEVDKNV